MEVEEQPVSEDVPLVSSSRGHQVELGNLADNDGRIAVVDSVNKFQWGFFYVFCFLVDHCISYIAGVVSKCLLRLFCGLYCLAGQYINCEKSSSKCFSVFGFFCFFLQLCLCVGYVGTVGTIEGLRIANYSFIINITVNDSINCTLPQEHWKFSTAVTVSAVAAIFSYGLMTLVVLIPVCIIRCRCCPEACCSSECCSNGCRCSKICCTV